jgi:hypothetical protein
MQWLECLVKAYSSVESQSPHDIQEKRLKKKKWHDCKREAAWSGNHGVGGGRKKVNIIEVHYIYTHFYI